MRKGGKTFHRFGRHGRLMRDDQQGGQTPTGDNQGVTTPPAGQTPTGGDNDGQTLDLGQFWSDPNEGNEDNSNNGQQSQGGDDSDDDIGKTLVTEIGQYNPGAFFTPEIAKEISEGNLEGANKQFQTMMQATLRQAVINSAKIMQRFEQAIDQRITSHVQSNQRQVGDEQLLKDSFPSFANPATQPMIRGVFNQSLKHSKGDRSKAVAMAKDFLRSMGTQGGEDFGFTPPRNPDDNMMSNQSKSLVEDLLGMR